MNRVYRIVRNEQTGSAVAVAESARGRGKRNVRGAVLMTSLIAGAALQLAHAAPGANQLPTGGQVVSGLASVTQSGNAMTVRQGSDKLVANWSTFNIGKDASVQFVQPGSNSVALNRISDSSASQIFGSLSANGQVFLLNPSGIVFGPTARVDVGSLVASTLDLSNENFLSGNYQFARNGTAGSVVNQGLIKAHGGGGNVVAFIAPQVSNTGSITADGGNAVLASGDKISLDFSGNGLIKVQVDQGTFNALAENKGLIQADGGTVIMTARTASDLMDAVVNNEGTIQARTLQNKAGRIMLLADMAHGTTRVGGMLDASAPQGGDGGFVETSAAKVTISDSARVKTLASRGRSGTWLIDPNDFTIAAMGGGDTSGAALGFNLSMNGSLTIATSPSGTGGNGDIYVNDNITVPSPMFPGSPVASTLTLQAGRDIVFQAGKVFNASAYGAPFSVVLQSNATDSATGGAIVMLPGSGIYSGGGNITLSGGSLPFTSTYAVGRDGLGAVGGVAGVGGGADAGNGIALIGATLSSAGGNILLRGKSVSGGNVANSALLKTAHGIFINELGGVGSLIDSGAGTLTITGLSTGTITATDFGHAVSVSTNSKIRSAATSGTAISITGDSSGVTATTGSDGVFNDGTIEATAGGNVSIAGISGPDLSPAGPYGYGMYINGKVLASGGSITLNGTGSTFGIGMNNPSQTGTIAVDATALASSVSMTSNTAMILGGPISATGPVSLVSTTGTDMQGAVKSTAGTVTLQTGFGPGTLSFGGYISAPSLLVSGAAFQLLGQLYVPLVGTIIGGPSMNVVGTVAANVTGSGGFSFMNSGNLTIGTVGATNGITMSGSGFIAVATSGNLNIAQNISSAYNGALNGGIAAALVAGNGAFAGDAAAGNITVTGSPVISVGAGGNADLFSSGIAGSTGLAALISPGNFRYNSSFRLGLASLASPSYWLTTGYTPTTLGAGLYAFYREQPAVTLTMGSPTITYGATPVPGLSVTAGAIQNGDSPGTPVIVGSTSTSGKYIAGVATVDAPANLAKLGYAVTAVPGTLTVLPALISAVTGITATSRAYDGTTVATINTGSTSFAGMVAGDVLSEGGAAVGVFVDKNVGNGKTVNISGLSLAGADYLNYALASTVATASANITAASLGVSGATALNRVYNGTNSATVSGATLVGTVFAGDSVTLTNASSGTFTDKNVGSAKAVTVVAALSGAGATNYTLTQPTGLSANITPASISAITGVTAVSRAYDGTTAAALNTGAAGFTGMVAGDVLAVAGGVGAFTDKNVGVAKAVSISGMGLGGTDAGNYTLGSTTATSSANIMPASLSVSGASAQNKTYDGMTSATISGATLAGTVYAGDAVTLGNATSGTFADKNVGTAKAVSVTATLSGVGATNYTLTQPTGLSANITPASLSVSGATAQNKVYDGSTSATVSGATLVGLYAGDVVTLTNATSGTFADKNVGTAKAVSVVSALSGAAATNYTLTQPTGLSANITPASLSVSGATAQNKVYDGTTSATISGATLAGTVYAGDSVTLTNATRGTFADADVGTAKPVSMSATIGGTGATNYVLRQQAGLAADITSAAASAGSLVAQLTPAGQSPSVTTPVAFTGNSTQTPTLISFGSGVSSPASTSNASSPSTTSSSAAAPAASADNADPKSATAASNADSGAGSTSTTVVQDSSTGVKPAASTAPAAPAIAAAPAPSQSSPPVAAQAKATVAAAVSTTSKAVANSIAAPAAIPNTVARAAPARTSPPTAKPGPGNVNAALTGKAMSAAPGLAGLGAKVPDAIKNFAASVPDVVGQKNPLLAESRIVPKAPEPDVRTLRQDEFTQSFDVLPSALSSTVNAKARQSKADILYEEGMEVVNFVNLLVLKIIP